MKKYIETIDLINGYINNTLSKTERLTFENRLETDEAFNTAYEEQLTFIEGIKRTQLVAEIQKVKQNYIRKKWMKYMGVSFSIILISALIYNFIFKDETPQISESIEFSEIEVVSDSIAIENPSEEKTEIKAVVEKSELKTVTEEKEIGKKQKSTIVNEPVLEEEKINNSAEILEIKTPLELSSELVKFYNSVEKTPQIIKINTEKEFTVTCKEGTKLTIPAQSFVDVKSGKLARGIIDLRVTEYYKLSDMLLANLTTKSDEKVLETGGMLHLDANKKGSKLKLKDGKRIKMAFNNKGKKGMQLFSGEKKGDLVNWKLQNDKEELTPEDVEVAIDVVENVPVFPGCEIGDNVEKKKCMNEKINKFIQRKFNTAIAEELKLTGTHKISVFFKVNKNGNIVDAVARASHIKLAREAIRLVDLLPKMIPAKQRGMTVRVPYYFPIKFKVEGASLYRRANVEARSIKTSSYRLTGQIDSVGIKNVNRKDIVRYAFSSTSLGWINCDRFVRMKNRKKYRLKIKNFDDADVKLVFKSMNAILSSKNYGEIMDFGWISGKEEEVLLIAIKKNENELYLGIEERKTGNTSDLNFDYKKVSIDELRDRLDELSVLF